MLTSVRHCWPPIGLVALIAVAYAAPARADAPAKSSAANADRQQQIAAAVLAAMEKDEVPGASLAVIEDYEIAWTAGYGRKVADSENAVTPETLFQAASISKPITAMATLKLVEQGKLDLDASVNDQLKSWSIPKSNIAQRTPIKLRHLLSHYAGLTVHGFNGYTTTEQRPTLVQVLNGEQPANSPAVRPVMRAEYKFSYSGGGYSVLQQLLIDVSGEPFPAFMQETVLGPLRMSHSTYEQPFPAELAAEAAAGHRPKGLVLAGQWHVYPEMAAAGLWTTPSDLALAAIDLSKSYSGQGGQILSQEMARKMLTLQNSHCGLGFFVNGEGQHLKFEHGGANEGFRCMLVAYPETGQGVAMMTNSDTGSNVLTSTIKLVADLYDWPTND